MVRKQPAAPGDGAGAAVVLGGSVTALSVARGLGRAGARVYALGDVRHSRYCHTFAGFANPDARQAQWLDWLEHGPRRAVILPTSDDGLELVAYNRARLIELGYFTIEADDAVLLAMLNKEKTYELARRIGIPAPRTATIRRPEDLPAAAEGIGYPCAIKPVYSHRFVQHFGRKAFQARDAAELGRMAKRPLELGLELLVTEIIPGPDDRIVNYGCYIDPDGRPLLEFTTRILRKYPDTWGLDTLIVTTHDPELARIGLRFVQGIGLRGLADVRFKRDRRDGRLKLIECNHRFVIHNELARAAGVDLTRFVYHGLTGRPVPIRPVLRPGVYLWNPVNDVLTLRGYLARGELTLGAWARSLLHRPHVPMASWDDPSLALFHHLRLIRRAAGRRGGRVGRRIAGQLAAASQPRPGDS